MRTTTQDKLRSSWWVFLLVVSALGIGLLLYHTRLGLGTTGDSVHYLMGAQNLAEGNGFSRTSGGGELRPITMLPPFYSVILLGVGITGVDLIEGARILHALFFGVSLFLSGLLIYRSTNSIWTALIGSGLILVGRNAIYNHGWLLTEALFIFLVLLNFYILSKYLDRQKSFHLVLLGILTAFAMLTRYIGVSLLAAGVISILLLGKGNWRRRLRDGFLLGLMSVAPMLLWLWRNASLTGTSVNRAFDFHLVPADLVRAYRAQITFWFVPSQLGFKHEVRRALMVLLAFTGPAIFFFLDLRDRVWKKNPSRSEFWATPYVLAFFVVSYVAALYFNLTFFDAVIDFNVVTRYLAPLFISLVLFFVIVFHRLVVQRWNWLPARILLLSLGLGMIVLYAIDTFSLVQDPMPNIGYTAMKVERPETVSRLRELNKSAPIISNDPEMVFILANRTAYAFPIRYDFNTRTEREDFKDQIRATQDKLQAGGMVVLFQPISEGDLEIVDLIGADLIDSFSRSAFYGYPSAFQD